jgi:hypothetical protein
MNALSQNFQVPSYGDAVAGVMAFIERPSKDTTPVEFSVGDVRYKVPRNYIEWMDNYKGGPQVIVKCKATFPGFEPLTDKTEQCLRTRAREPQGCIPVRFLIDVLGDTFPTDEDVFERRLRRYKVKTATLDANGFEVYKSGKGRLYRKKTAKHTLFFSCRLRDDEELIRTMGKGPCNVRSVLPGNKNALIYTFQYERVNDAEAIDNGIRQLLDSFTIKGE